MKTGKMLKNRLLIISISAALVVIPGYALAVVTGACVNCHTMHNSQNGSVMATYGQAVSGSTGPNSVLTRGTCVGCHAQATANNTITIGTSKIPQVYHTNATDLAGGNFGYVDGTKGGGAAVTKGHNVVAALPALGGDTNLASPPGDSNTSGITSGAGGNFTCGGTKGCHGDRSVANELSAIKGAHHSSDTTIDGTTVAKSYRFLKGVKGVENNDATNGWLNSTLVLSNKYQGFTSQDTATLTSPGANATISGFCGECHGNFHTSGGTGIGVSGAWLRHPTDIALPNVAPYDAYDPTTTYDATVPVAYVDPATPTRATAVVMCLSCHGVHGTNYADVLRWDYTTMVAGTTGGAAGTGCFKCHRDKDGVV